MPASKITTIDLEIYRLNPAIAALKRLSPTFVTGLVGVLLIAALYGANLHQHSLGTMRDFHLISDIRTIFDHVDRHVPASFPMLRDFASWLLLTQVLGGLYVLQRQLKLMSECLSKLSQNGVLVARPSSSGAFSLDLIPKWVPYSSLVNNLIVRLLSLKKFVDGCDEPEAFNASVVAINNKIERTSSWLSWPGFVVSFFGGAFLVVGVNTNFFNTLAPRSVSKDDRAQWLNAAYNGWWASFANHHWGWAVFSLCAFIGVAVVFSFIPSGFLSCT